MTSQIKVGVLPWGQRTDWASLQRVGQRADELGFDSLWTWDHLYPIQGDWRGPIFEGYMILAGWAAVAADVLPELVVPDVVPEVVPDVVPELLEPLLDEPSDDVPETAGACTEVPAASAAPEPAVEVW